MTVQKEAALRVKRENPASDEYKSDTGLQNRRICCLHIRPDCVSKFGKCVCPDFLPVAIEFDCTRYEPHFAESYVSDIVPVLLSGEILTAKVVEKHANAESVFA